MRHLRGQGCKKCGDIKIGNALRKSKEQFIIDSRKIHYYLYDYKKVIYINSHICVIITCPKHGDFPCSPSNHLSGKGCPKCKHSKMEDKIYKFLQSQDVEFETQKKFDNCIFINQLPFDFT